MPIFKVIGKASQTIYSEFSYDEEELNEGLSLMDFLINHKIPIASSCLGKGHCKRCTVNQNDLSCQTKVKDYLKNFKSCEVGYL